MERVGPDLMRYASILPLLVDGVDEQEIVVGSSRGKKTIVETDT